MSAGKGDSQRRVNGEVYRENFEFIDWFMRSMGFDCPDEEEAYHLRGLLDM